MLLQATYHRSISQSALTINSDSTLAFIALGLVNISYCYVKILVSNINSVIRPLQITDNNFCFPPLCIWCRSPAALHISICIICEIFGYLDMNDYCNLLNQRMFDFFSAV